MPQHAECEDLLLLSVSTSLPSSSVCGFFRMLSGHGKENGDVTLSFSQCSYISQTRWKTDSENQQWRWLLAAAGHGKKRKISRCRLRSRCLIHPHYNRVLILTAHCFSPAPETWWCSPPLWHTAVREGVCPRPVQKEIKRRGARDHTKWKWIMKTSPLVLCLRVWLQRGEAEGPT